MCRPDALLLDFGGVVTRTLFECRGALERHFGLPGGALRWWGPLDPQADPLWLAVLAEEIGEGEYWRRRVAELGALLGRALEMRDLIAAAGGGDPNRLVRPEAVATIRATKAAGWRVGVLSNELELLYGRDAPSSLRILAEIDCVVDLSRSVVRKPSPAAYAQALASLGSPAERTVFVDDQPRNVAAARAVGMHAICFDIRDCRGSFRRVSEA